MKIIKIILWLLLVFACVGLPILSFAQPSSAVAQDTVVYTFVPRSNGKTDTLVCLSVPRLGRIADTLAYLRQFERYAAKSDSAMQQCDILTSALQSQNLALRSQTKDAIQGAELLAIQLGKQKAVYEECAVNYAAMDAKLQKSKRQGRVWGTLFGVAAGGGLLAGLLLGLL